MKKYIKFTALLLVFGGFGGMIWYAASEKDSLTEDGKLPLVKAPETAVKVRAKNPGGMVIPNRDKKIFDLLEVTGGKAVVSKEEAQRVDCKSADGVKSNCLKEEKNLPEIKIVRKQVAQKSPQVALQKTQQKASKTAQKTVKIEDVIKQYNKIEPASSGSISNNDTTTKDTAKLQQPKAKQPMNQAYSLTKKPAKPVATGGKWGVQLASYRSVDEAAKGIAIFQKKYGDLLAGLSQKVQKADLGAKGIYYRVKFFGLADKTAAKSLCAKLKAKNQGCLHVNN